MLCACWIVENVASNGPQIHWTDYVSAFGPFAAAAAAIGIAVWAVRREHGRHPVLSVKFDASTDDYLPNNKVPGKGAHYVRARVANANGKDTAHGVEILLKSIRNADTGEPVSPGGYAFRWSNVAPDDHDRPRTQLNIAAGIERHFDILAMDRPYTSDRYADKVVAESGTTGPGIAEIQIFPEPADRSHRLREGNYEFVLAVSSDNTDAIEQTIRMEFDGLTCEGECIRDHLTLKL